PPALIVSDILMPVMDGFSLCLEWKKDGRLRAIPFVFYTATYTDERDRDFALSLGAEGFMVKPVEPEVFLRAIRDVLQQVQSPPAVAAQPAGSAPGGQPAHAPHVEEAVYLKQYNEALIRKLERKMQQLEQVNRRLEQDIAERRRADEALRESEDRFKWVFEHSNTGKSMTRSSGELQVNQAFCDLLGYSLAELQQQSWQAITHPEDIEPTQREVDALLSGKQDSARFTKRYLHKRGSVVWADVSTTLRRDEAGQPLYFMTTVIDITGRKKAEAELEKRNAFVETILANAPISFAVNTIHDGQGVFVSRNFERIYGVPPDSLHTVADHFEKVYLDPVFREQIRARMMAGMASRDAARMRWENIPITTDTGEHKVVTAINIPLFEQNLMISTVQDVT
ncbi:MAG: PAS domain S-box protein, partial [Spirochaetes bacterium]|nr:PAS domain S-box protein [Spirochaetota bacterium]